MMATHPEDVAAPAGDVKVFRTSRPRTFARLVPTFTVLWLVIHPALSWLLGDDDPVGPWWGTLLQAVLSAAMFAALFTFITPVHGHTWVRTSKSGLELLAAGSDPIQLAWSDISRAEVRRTWWRSVLEVIPVDMDRVRQVRDGNGMPQIRGGAFIADVSYVVPGPRALHREVNRGMSTTTGARR